MPLFLASCTGIASSGWVKGGSESEGEPERLSCEGVWRLGHVFDATHESGYSEASEKWN